MWPNTTAQHTHTIKHRTIRQWHWNDLAKITMRMQAEHWRMHHNIIVGLSRILRCGREIIAKRNLMMADSTVATETAVNLAEINNITWTF